MIDAILCWPQYADYPLWREWHTANRHRFHTYIVFTPHSGLDLRAFVRDHVDAEFLDSPANGEWRDVAVNAALDRSTAEWVWFTEQDLTILDPERFWPRFDRDGYGFREDNGRWHPASLFLRRSVIDQTSRYFGPEPVDHFWTFSQELAPFDIGHLRGFTHMQGESQNQFLRQTEQAAGFFRRDAWRDYLRACLGADVPRHPDWERWALQEIG